MAADPTIAEAAATASRAPLALEELLLRAQAPAPFTVADLEALPVNDGYRYELVDGTLIVSPSPGLAHQRMVTSLLRQLLAACPPRLEVLPGPFDVKPGGDRVFAPDIMAARPADYSEHGIIRPLLAVEIRSPSSGLYDRTLKRAAYAEAGIPSYWLVDPQQPSISVLELSPDGYVEVARATGAQPVTVGRPFPVTIRLAGMAAG